MSVPITIAFIIACLNPSLAYADMEGGCFDPFKNYQELYRKSRHVLIAKLIDSRSIRIVKRLKGRNRKLLKKDAPFIVHGRFEENANDRRIYFLAFDGINSCSDDLPKAFPITYRKGIEKAILKSLTNKKKKFNRGSFHLPQSTIKKYAHQRKNIVKKSYILFKKKHYRDVVNLLTRSNFFVHEEDYKRAFILARSYRRLGNTTLALKTVQHFLKSTYETPQSKVMIHYNGACYASILGKHKVAYEFLKDFEWNDLDPGENPEMARVHKVLFTDPDLKKFRASKYFSLLGIEK